MTDSAVEDLIEAAETLLPGFGFEDDDEATSVNFPWKTEEVPGSVSIGFAIECAEMQTDAYATRGEAEAHLQGIERSGICPSDHWIVECFWRPIGRTRRDGSPNSAGLKVMARLQNHTGPITPDMLVTREEGK